MDKREIEDAVILLFEKAQLDDFPQLTPNVRQQQYWALTFSESAAYSFNKFESSMDDRFNITMLHRRDSTLPAPLKRMDLKQHKYEGARNYALNKTKGAYVYVSNCNSVGYNRMELIEILQKYIPVDIFGTCTHVIPCADRNGDCESKLHKNYRFYLSFENSLCADYITEKFWLRLGSAANVIPIAMGGTNLSDYLTSVTPPDSYIHVRNFTDIPTLGKYLQFLMSNDQAYNRYHRWRDNFSLTVNLLRYPGCELCKIAYEKPRMPAVKDLSSWWNDEGSCAHYPWMVWDTNTIQPLLRYNVLFHHVV